MHSAQQAYTQDAWCMSQKDLGSNLLRQRAEQNRYPEADVVPANTQLAAAVATYINAHIHAYVHTSYTHIYFTHTTCTHTFESNANHRKLEA